MATGKPAHISPARREAFGILLEVERGHAHSDDLLRGARVSALSAQDRNLCTTLVMGVLRWQISLDGVIRTLLAKPNARLDREIGVALRLGAFQLQHLDRIPAHAAIGEAVALAKQAGHRFASGMVNAVLRKIAALPKAQAKPYPNQGAGELAAATAHPLWLVERWVEQYGLEAARNVCEHGQHQPEVILRLESAAVEAELAAEGIHMEVGSLLTAARRVVAGDVTAATAFRSGGLRIQEEGSQLVAELAGHGTRILDCCAAPGGKTLILAERNPRAQIVACEISPARLEALSKRVAMSPFADRIQTKQGNAEELGDVPEYDLVLADVPCSGTGTLGRNPEIRHRLQPADLERHHQRQCAILRGAMRASNARVIYSTCSLEPEENSNAVSEVLAGAQEWRQVSTAGAIQALRDKGRLTSAGAESLLGRVSADGSLTLLPGAFDSEVSADGFFIAILEKCG